VIAGACPPRTARVAAEEIRRDARFVHEDKRPRIVEGLRLTPATPLCGDVGAMLLAGVYRFF
jgi:hypothetical protein